MEKQTICDSCGNPIQVKSKCLCHDCQRKEADLRFMKIMMTGIVSFFLSSLGGCFIYHKYNSDTVRAALQYYEIKKTDKTGQDNRPDILKEAALQDYEVVPKPEPKK
jgi:hypothetical protein